MKITKNRRTVLLVLAGILLSAGGAFLFLFPGTNAPDAGIRPEEQQPALQRHIPPPPVKQDRPTDRYEASYEYDEAEAEPAAVHSEDIEEIKKQIYDLDIEYVEDLHLLDSVVRTGDAHTHDLWAGGWESADDWKEEANGFNLEPQGDGTFIFYPDEATTRTYTFFETPRTYEYDPSAKEFYWEIDYYGKTISHIARFINEDVLATMLISGDKVTLDIYRKHEEGQ